MTREIGDTIEQSEQNELQRADDIIGHNVSGTESRQQNDFIEEKMKEFDNSKLIRILKGANDFDETQYKIMIGIVKDFLKSSLLQQKEAIEKELLKEIDKLDLSLAEINNGYLVITKIKELLK